MKIVSLRTPKPYGQRTNVDILIEPKKKYFLVVEGSNTEIDYFYGIDNYRSELGIDQLIGIIPLERAEENTTDSHPMHLLNAALMKTGMIDAPENYELLEYDYKIDEIWLIFDRDPGSFHKEQFDKIYETCKEKDFHIGFTNPNFEFWLLLHLPEVNHYDRECLLKNKKLSSKRHYIDTELSSRMCGYNKKSLCFNKFKDGIDLAIAQEKLFEEDELEIFKGLGSNIGKLINKMKTDFKTPFL